MMEENGGYFIEEKFTAFTLRDLQIVTLYGILIDSRRYAPVPQWDRGAVYETEG